MKCFYHSADLDGHCSGAIVKHFNPECELIGINYGDPFPWEGIGKREEVIMVDFSLQPFTDMLRLFETSCGVTWIDHHKTAIDDFNRSTGVAPFFVRLDTTKAACELTWEIFSREAMPQAVHWLGRYDIWKHAETPGSLEFQYGMRTRNTDPSNQELWGRLFADDEIVEYIREDGEKFLDYERTQNESFIRAYGFDVEFDGLRCIAANRGMTNSLLFESVWNPDKYDAMMPFAWRGGKWTVSLYSDKPDVDVSAVCKARGGGGHKGAAGFQAGELPFLIPAKAAQ